MNQIQPSSDKGLVQRGLLLLGGMTALVAVVLVIALRRPETPTSSSNRREPPLIPIAFPEAGFPAAATVALSTLVKVGDQLPSSAGWEIRYNAALALARRGNAKTPWPLVGEMLDEEHQRRNFRTLSKKNQVQIDGESARRTVHNALTALGQWHEKQDRAAVTSAPAPLQKIYEQVDQLAQHAEPPVRVHADRVRKTFIR